MFAQACQLWAKNGHMNPEKYSQNNESTSGMYLLQIIMNLWYIFDYEEETID